MKNISKEKLKRVRIPMVDFDIQQRFGALVRLIREQENRIAHVYAGDDALFASLQSRAFKGEL